MNDKRPTLLDTLLKQVKELNNEVLNLKRKTSLNKNVPIIEVSLFIISLYWFFILIDANLFISTNIDVIKIFEHIMNRYIWAGIFLINLFLIGYGLISQKAKLIHKISLFYSFILMAMIASLFYVFGYSYNMFMIVYYIFSIQSYIQMKRIGD